MYDPGASFLRDHGSVRTMIGILERRIRTHGQRLVNPLLDAFARHPHCARNARHCFAGMIAAQYSRALHLIERTPFETDSIAAVQVTAGRSAPTLEDRSFLSIAQLFCGGRLGLSFLAEVRLLARLFAAFGFLSFTSAGTVRFRPPKAQGPVGRRHAASTQQRSCPHTHHRRVQYCAPLNK